MAKKKSSKKRELINTERDKRYARRDAQGHFEESDDTGRSLSQDRSGEPRSRAKRGRATVAIAENRNKSQ